MGEFVSKFGLKVAAELAEFVETQALPGNGIEADRFWDGFSGIVHDLGPKNRVLLAKRTEIQAQLDAWHIAQRGQPHDAAAYTAFLKEIGYLVPEGPAFSDRYCQC